MAKPPSSAPASPDDLLAAPVATDASYTASAIEVLEGLEPVRRRPGMYIGGTDERALHHLVAEVLDNAMDEAVAGHASRIELAMEEDGHIRIADNGRGIPVDPHPKFPDKSALEVILTTLHSGGKFSGKAYATSGGLHGVGISVVNALSESLTVEVARDRRLHSQRYSRGDALEPIQDLGAVSNRRGTTVRFRPDPEIFGADARLRAHRIYKLARSKAYLFKGVEIRWSCPASLVESDHPVPETETLHFPGGLADYLQTLLGSRPLLSEGVFAGDAEFPDGQGRVEWAIAWVDDTGEPTVASYCNTIPTPQGGSHETGMRAALTRSLKDYGEMAGNKRASHIQSDDALSGAVLLLSCFIREPQFQGQTKEKLATPLATQLVQTALKDRSDQWFSADTARAGRILEHAIEAAEERQRRRKERETQRKSATKRLRLPGKLADCANATAEGTELFIVEGDSAGGSAKQARDRKTQAILPLRGKILNVASASRDKLNANAELSDLVLALGCGRGRDFEPDKLRYERVIIMTDADVDGAHIASLLITFFFREMTELVKRGHLYLALPPLYRIAQSGTVRYAMDDADKDRLMAEVFTGKAKIELSRFKGLGEMPPRHLKDTTMDPSRRSLIQVQVPDTTTAADDHAATVDLVERLMGKRADARFQFIQDHARFVEDVDV